MKSENYFMTHKFWRLSNWNNDRYRRFSVILWGNCGNLFYAHCITLSNFNENLLADIQNRQIWLLIHRYSLCHKTITKNNRKYVLFIEILLMLRKSQFNWHAKAETLYRSHFLCSDPTHNRTMVLNVLLLLVFHFK